MRETLSWGYVTVPTPLPPQLTVEVPDKVRVHDVPGGHPRVFFWTIALPVIALPPEPMSLSVSSQKLVDSEDKTSVYKVGGGLGPKRFLWRLSRG